MSRKFFKRWSPDPNSIKAHSKWGFLHRLLDDPNLFHLTRYSVSTACLVGFFICFFPLPVGHIPIVAVVSLWLRCNLPIAFALTMISNPITFPLVYFIAYRVGSWVLQLPVVEFKFEASWSWLRDSFAEIWAPIVVGNLTLGLTTGILSYFMVHWIWRWQVMRRWRLRKEQKKYMD